MKFPRYLFHLLVFFGLCPAIFGQEGFTNQTRALYILDISRYVEFSSVLDDQEDFIITILEKEVDLYWELERLAKTRKTIQDKPIRILVSSQISKLQPGNVVFVNRKDGYQIKDVLKAIHGSNTLLISEGYPFRSSMINFVVIEGEPKFEANEELMTSEGLFVNDLFLAQAVKTREDWEALYEVAEDELQIEKGITEQQAILIEKQQLEISEQEEMIKENNATLSMLRGEIETREKEIEQKSLVLESQKMEIESQKADIEAQKSTIEDQETEVAVQQEILFNQERNILAKETTISAREEEIRVQDEKIVLQAEAIQKQKIIIIAAIVAVLLLFGLVYFIWRNYRNKKKANILLQSQRDQIAYQKKHITDSIQYAKKIQTAILPSLELFTDKVEHFVLFKPRDIVSGDFYWVEEINGDLIIITADCTGHGVPGAFMSMLGVSMLNEIVLNEGISRPDEILNVLREKIIVALKQDPDSMIKDGMDMTICVLDRSRKKLLYSGAENPLILISGDELNQVKGDKMPVAIHEVMEPFTLHELDLKNGDSFYTFSDGYADQFGGPRQKKFMIKNLRNLLLSVQDLSMMEQGRKLDETFEAYRSELDQVDDVVVIGVRV
jgi:serine phosphatase RsbU (regulator of sigma subunit)